MVECEVFKIIIDERSQEQVIVLKEKSGQRLLPIVIGTTEAAAIRMEFGSFTPPRPLTHDLLKTVILSLKAKLDRIVIDKLDQGTFYAKLIIVNGGAQPQEIDARPSDSIAIAVRMHSPIFVEEEVLKKSSYTNS
jgi:uncharacterized protein